MARLNAPRAWQDALTLIAPEEKLGGNVNIDDTRIGGKAENRHWNKHKATYRAETADLAFFWQCILRVALSRCTRKGRLVGEIEMSKPASGDFAVRPNVDVIAKRLDQQSVLVHIPTNRIFELNETGTRVWEMIGESLNRDQIIRRLVEEFDVEEARAAGEVNELLTRLKNEGLLSPS